MANLHWVGSVDITFLRAQHRICRQINSIPMALHSIMQLSVPQGDIPQLFQMFNGKFCRTNQTFGDGACSIHSVFGSLTGNGYLGYLWRLGDPRSWTDMTLYDFDVFLYDFDMMLHDSECPVIWLRMCGRISHMSRFPRFSWISGFSRHLPISRMC